MTRCAHILLVDDDADARLIMSRLLRRAGHVAYAAPDGPAALALLEREASIELLLSDIGLPGMDGCELLRRMRASGRAIPAIALTGFDGPGLAERCRGVGFAEVLIKPIDFDAVLAAVQRLARNGDPR
jgi:two-component system CheB/CheR fusion protein